MEICLAADVGATKLAVGLVSIDGTLLDFRRAATPHVVEDGSVVFDALEELLRAQAERTPKGAQLVACGIGCGGPMAKGGFTVSPLNIPAWRQFPLREQVADATGLATYVDNDAKAYALGEGWSGAARGLTNYMAMVVSSGVGGGVVVDGKLLEGLSGNAGHVGHVIVEPEGQPCACGARGCLEAEASGTAIRRITGTDPRHASPTVVKRVGTLVGRAAASVCTLLDLDLVVVGGSVALGFGAPFFEAATAELAARARIEFVSEARIVAGAAKERCNLIGAAAVGFRGIGYPVPAWLG